MHNASIDVLAIGNAIVDVIARTDEAFLARENVHKGAMQLTPDESTVGNPAESIQFSVRWGQECLIGQVGPATGAPVTVVVPALAEGTCLIGDTRPIDW